MVALFSPRGLSVAGSLISSTLEVRLSPPKFDGLVLHVSGSLGGAADESSVEDCAD